MTTENLTQWTDANEKALQEMLQRRAAWMTQNGALIHHFVEERWMFSKTSSNSSANMETLSKWLIENAEDVRDLLLPFDLRQNTI